MPGCSHNHARGAALNRDSCLNAYTAQQLRARACARLAYRPHMHARAASSSSMHLLPSLLLLLLVLTIITIFIVASRSLSLRLDIVRRNERRRFCAARCSSLV